MRELIYTLANGTKTTDYKVALADSTKAQKFELKEVSNAVVDEERRAKILEKFGYRK